jgi:hypothetical protein
MSAHVVPAGCSERAPLRADLQVLGDALDQRLARSIAQGDALPAIKDAAALLTLPATMQRYSLPMDVLARLSAQLKAADPAIRAAYLKRLFIHLLADLPERIAREPVPASIGALVAIEADRIAGELGSHPDAFYEPDADAFLKDLGILTLRLLPCGAELAQVHAGVPRSLLLRGGFVQLLRGLWFFSYRTAGFAPFVSLHMDIRNLAAFTPAGWDETYLRLAELLDARPQLKGVFGTAWFYDPAMTWVSQHLAYLRQRRIEGGAAGFSFGPTPEARANALARSARRRELAEAGRYTPCSYYVVWPRAELLAWAERRRSDAHRTEGRTWE